MITRIRTVKPDFFLDEELAQHPPLERLLFQGLWLLADRAGRLEDRPARIKAVVLPYDDCDVEAMLASLAASQFIERYEVAGRKLISVKTFARHQRPNHREPESELPPPECAPVDTGMPGRAPVDTGTPTGKGREGKGITNPPFPPLLAQGGHSHTKAPGGSGVAGQVERLIAHAQAKGVPLSGEDVRRIRRELKAGLPSSLAAVEASINARADAIATEVAHQQAFRDAEAWIVERGGLDAAVEQLAAWLSTQQRPEESRRDASDRWQESLSVPPYARSMLVARLPSPAARSHSPPGAATA